MGYRETGAKQAQFTNLSQGWFPGKVFSEIPGEFSSPDSPVGAIDCNNVIWNEGKLQRMFGYTEVQSSALNGGVDTTSIFYSRVLGNLVGTVEDKIYSDLDSATPTDITGSVVVSTSALPSWTDWQFQSTTLYIGVDGVNPPWKWTGSSTCAALGGTPPNGKWVIRWQNAIWIANTSSAESTLYFSNLADPETWDTSTDAYVFDAPITGLGTLGDFLVVFMDDHIGVLSGDNNRALIKVDRYVDGVGCSGGHTIAKVKVENRDYLMFHANDGFYLFDGTKGVTKLSHPIQKKYTDPSSTSRWNDSRYDQAWATYNPRFGWYMIGISDAADTSNDFMLIIDLKRLFQTPEGVSAPHWPLDGIDSINCITFSQVDANKGDVFFGSNDGKFYKMGEDTFNYNSSTYTSFFKSKVFDLTNSFLTTEINVLGKELGASSSITFSMKEGLEEGEGVGDTVNFSDSGDLLDSTFILDSSTLEGKNSIFRNVGTSAYGRFLQFQIETSSADHEFQISGVDFVLQPIGLEPNSGN